MVRDDHHEYDPDYCVPGWQDLYGPEMEVESGAQYKAIEKEFLKKDEWLQWMRAISISGQIGRSERENDRAFEDIRNREDEVRRSVRVPVIVKLCSLSVNRRPCPGLVRLALSHFLGDPRDGDWRGHHWRAIEGLLHGPFPFRVLTEDTPPESHEYATLIRERFLPNNDVLLHVFSFLSNDVRCLVRVSSVCRSWRERSAALGQWEGFTDRRFFGPHAPDLLRESCGAIGSVAASTRFAGNAA